MVEKKKRETKVLGALNIRCEIYVFTIFLIR